MAICGDCKGIMWMGGHGYRCAFKNIDLDAKTVEERIEIECDKFQLAPRDVRIPMKQYIEVATTKVYGNGSVQIPSEIRNALKIQDGDKILWIKKGRREFTFRKVGYRGQFKPQYR